MRAGDLLLPKNILGGGWHGKMNWNGCVSGRKDDWLLVEKQKVITQWGGWGSWEIVNTKKSSHFLQQLIKELLSRIKASENT